MRLLSVCSVSRQIYHAGREECLTLTWHLDKRRRRGGSSLWQRNTGMSQDNTLIVREGEEHKERMDHFFHTCHILFPLMLQSDSLEAARALCLALVRSEQPST